MNSASPSYQSIQVNDTMEDNHDTVVIQERATSPKSRALYVGATLLVFLIGSLMTNRHLTFQQEQEQGLASLVDMEGSANPKAARACTFTECLGLGASCDHKLAPYVCLRHNGGPHGGCSGIDWTPESCDESCDLGGCDKLEIPKDMASCAGLKCGTEWCKSGQLCGKDVPYQCTDGPARFGCTSDAYHWVLAKLPCCDVTTCN